MKIAVSSSGRDLQSQIDPRFGRCDFFLLIETENMSFEVFPNENAALGQGAGIQSAQFVASKGAQAVITGHCGPNAAKTLSAAGIRIYTSQSGTVGEAVDRFNRGRMTPTEEANVGGHFGISVSGGAQIGPSQGPGTGMGRGRGCGGGGGGGGGGLGRGKGRCMTGSGWSISPGTSSDDQSREETLKALKAQARELRRQLEDIEAKIGGS